MALWFYCELAREERHKAMTSKTLSLALNKRVFSVFVNHKHRVLPVTRFIRMRKQDGFKARMAC